MGALFGRELFLLFTLAALFALAAGLLPQLAAGLEGEGILPHIHMIGLRGLLRRRILLLRLLRRVLLLHGLRLRVLRVIRVCRLRGLHGGGRSLAREYRLCALALLCLRRARLARACAGRGGGRIAQADVQKVRRAEDEQREDDIAADVGGQAHDGVDEQAAKRAARHRGAEAALARGEAVAEVGAVALVREPADRRRDGVREAEGEQHEQRRKDDRACGRLDVLAGDERDARVGEQGEHDERRGSRTRPGGRS